MSPRLEESRGQEAATIRAFVLGFRVYGSVVRGLKVFGFRASEPWVQCWDSYGHVSTYSNPCNVIKGLPAPLIL